LNLLGSVERGLKHRKLLIDLYDHGSDVLHGRRARGHQMLPPDDLPFVNSSLSIALGTLDVVCSREAVLDVAAPASFLQRGMAELRKALESDKGNASAIIQRALAPHGKLKRGRHYNGTGTREDPYRFADGFVYHSAFARLCEQLSLDAASRRTDFSARGLIIDVVQGEGREHCFLAGMACCA
jgi:hypothetical protein